MDPGRILGTLDVGCEYTQDAHKLTHSHTNLHLGVIYSSQWLAL